jgi:peptidoglycan hydrolase-like protein with peptidoglycan-binding domain
MSGELNFEAMPFEAYDGFRTLASELSGFELEEEAGHRASARGFSARAPRVMSKRLGTPQVSSRGKPKKPPFPQPRLPPFPGRRPWGVVSEPYGAAPRPYPPEPLPASSEYMRWVQSALNDVLALQLPVHGIADAATRSAIRSFQQREGLPVDGIVGPDTERALLAARGGKSPQEGAPGPATPTEPAPTAPAGELNFEWENFAQVFDNTRKSAERAAVKSRVAAGQRDPNALTDMLFFERHPERRGRPLRADEYKLADEWKAILRDVVLPELTQGPARPAVGIKVSDREVAATLAMASKTVPGLGITLEQLLKRYQAESGGIPVEVLLAFIRYEAGRLFDDATAGKWNETYKKYIPSFYELGVFQTPAGDHGCTNEAGVKQCKYRPPGRNLENSQFGKGWRRLAGTYPTESNWKDPAMQVRVGLWDLNSTADRVRMDFGALFPSKQSEWFLRMAVLYSFAAGAGAARSFLRKYKNELLALPEGRRWDFLRGKNVGTFYFNAENVDKKMALAAKFRAVRGTAVTQSAGGTQ